jgi:glutamine synthetase
MSVAQCRRYGYYPQAVARASCFARAAQHGDLVVDHYATVADHEWQQFLGVVTEGETQRYFEQS